MWGTGSGLGIPRGSAGPLTRGGLRGLPSWPPRQGSSASAGAKPEPPPEGPQAQSQSPGGGVGQQHGHRRSTGSSPKYREPTHPHPPRLGPRTGDGRDLSDLAMKEAQWPHIYPALEGGESWGPSGGDRGTPASAPRPALPPQQALQSPRDPGHFLPSVSLGWTGGWGLSDQGPKKERVT